MPRRATFRASDADREQIAERLRHATAEGRLLAEELEQRLGAAFSARTYGELDALVADLPGQMQPRRKSSLHPWMAPALGLAIAIPIALAMLVVVLFIVTSLFAVWMLWLAVGWWFFGHRRRIPGPGRSRSLHACGRWQGSRADAHPARGPWL